MSAKVKKRFEEMQAYLGRDTEGLKKLKLLKDDVNELRTSLALAKEQLEQIAAIKDAARERADAAEAMLARVRAEAASEKQRLATEVQNARADVSRVQAEWRELTGATACDAVTGKPGIAELRDTLFRLMCRVPTCPVPVTPTKHEAEVVFPLFMREDFATGWSQDALYTLGAAVAVLVTVSDAVSFRRAEGGVASEAAVRDTFYGDPAIIRKVLAWVTASSGQHGDALEGYIDQARMKPLL